MNMKVQVEEAAAKFQEILQTVKNGNDVLIMDKEKPVARIVPVVSDQPAKEDGKWTSDDFDIQLSKDQ